MGLLFAALLLPLAIVGTTAKKEFECYNNDWLYQSDMTAAIADACGQIGSVFVPKGETRGAFAWGLHLEGATSDEAANLFLGFTNENVDGGWYIDPNFCTNVGHDLMTHCAGKHSDSGGGAWHRSEGTVDLDPGNTTPGDINAGGGQFIFALDSDASCSSGSRVYSKTYECGTDFHIGDTYEGCYEMPAGITNAAAGYVVTQNVMAVCALYSEANCKGNIISFVDTQGYTGHIESSGCVAISSSPVSFSCEQVATPLKKRTAGGSNKEL
ncbi:hypothetical protein H2200_011657 [Cladophialophora chaetospira]|uniref:Uncharacterized protein n=1 Tax=Cladophialophora chaetospira TaxID=386627 RepID=A0AA38WZR5_9EURO|nr:hypothetical protein H2200_011657 [Cladophialophora chaetospira]